MREEVCAGIEEQLCARVPAGGPLRAPVAYALRGGKRARGLLLVLAGEGRIAAGALLRAAACLELLHAATLVQDDIFDGGRVRRGRAAVWCAFGTQTATLAADWMLAEAIRTGYRLGLEFGEVLSRCAQALMTGEAREFAPRGPASVPELRERALRIAEGKTGELFGLAMSASALLAGETAEAANLRRAGRALGVAFQYLDDTLDLYGSGAVAGKEVRSDLRSHLLTLPVLDGLALLQVAPTLSPDTLAALKAERVRRHVEACAHAKWRAALEAVSRRLPGREVESLLGSLAGKMLAFEGEQVGRPAA